MGKCSTACSSRARRRKRQGVSVNGNLKLIQFFQNQQLKFDTPLCRVIGVADNFLQLHILLFDGSVPGQ
jgi:hypothetical protein